MASSVEQHRANLDHYAKKVADLKAALDKAKAKGDAKSGASKEPPLKDAERLARNVAKHDEAAAEYAMWAEQALAAIQVEGHAVRAHCLGHSRGWVGGGV